MKNRIIAGVFAGYIFIIAIAGLIIPDKTFSENENRLLASFPKLVWEDILSGKFSSDVETYIADQFPLRDSWITLKTLSVLALGKQDSGGVYFGKDDYLIDKWDSVDIERFDKNLEYVKTFAQAMQDLGVNVDLMLVPTAAAILTDKLPAFAPEIDQLDLIERALQSGVDIVDVYSPLAAHESDYIYYRTDHHWTSLGAYLAYAAYMPDTLPMSEYEKEILTSDFFGTTWSKIGLPNAVADDLEGWYTPRPLFTEHNLSGEISQGIYEREHLTAKDKYPVYMGGNQSVTKITGGPANGKKLLLIKDSYGNTFAQFAPNDFEEVHMIDLRYYKTSVSAYMEQEGITDVLVLYNLKTFAEDKNIYSITTGIN